MKTYLVSGCGISVVCDSKESVLRWVEDIIDRGGTPVVELVELDQVA